MDFDLTEEQAALIGLVDRILADHCGNERLAELEKESVGTGGSVHDAAAWKALAEAGVAEALLPEPEGGGLGVLGLALLAQAAGRRTAYVPVVAALGLGALPLMRFGGPAGLLEDAVAGRVLVTAALEEPGEPDRLTTVARRDGDEYVIDGAKTFVPYGDLADHVLVPAEADGEPVVLIVPRAQPFADLELSGVRVAADALLARGAAALEWIRDVATVAYAAEAAGVCEEAVRMTAAYTSTRKQFGEPIASFQAVGQRAANAYIDAEVVRLTMLHAAWLLDADTRSGGRGPDTGEAVAIAKFHAGDAGSRVLHAAQHLHGGIGVDTDYPLHRYFVRGQQIEQTLGTATRQLLRVGARIAADPAPH
jgi:alkylation response protein AidB-like acyl-CoA dehydrogenase